MHASEAKIDTALNHALEVFAASTASSARTYGWGKKSVGAKVTLSNGSLAWLKVQYAEKGNLNPRNWQGELGAGALPGVAKPRVLRHEDWEDEFALWRAIVMTYVSDQPCSETPELRSSIAIGEHWFDELELSLAALREVETDRICVRQDLVNRRVKERFGSDINTTVDQWVCSHGDLHWANLTAPRLMILDWEGWGLAPAGTDEAFLLAFSLLRSDISDTLRKRFANVLSSRDGKLSILFVCAELLRMIELHQDHPDLWKPLEELARQVRSILP